MRKKIWFFKNKTRRKRREPSSRAYLAHKENARALAHRKLIEWNEKLSLSYGKVFIRDQKTRWGSCSSQKNLNFNYRIVFLPDALLDYLIVHELCHLRHLNHSKEFWSLVASVIPEYKESQRALRSISMSAIEDVYL